jgi:transcription-repair coupling factor (superfamily II helicase)
MQQTLDDRDRALLFGDEALRPGDAVVHFEHGLARYGGEETVELGDAAQVLTTFEYRHGGKLMVPAEEGRDFWPFGAPADDLMLDRLKTDDWVKRRDEMIAELRAGADRLLEEGRARRARVARPLVPDAEAYAALAAAFPHDETEDQARAIASVLADLARDVPMDRLLVGDVGFGKTEVAIRAAAAAALSGHQVVMAAPTTVLARQHAETLRARFEGIELAEISRLTEPAARAAILRAVAEGAARIVVGTQALLAEDVAFADPALVIVDEEQKFGAEQKRALRALSPGAHVLSLTATPIPRSLAAAEVGLLDVSVLATAPGGRRPVETRVRAPDPGAMRAAITRETARGGQCFVVCPRIEDLDRVERMLAELDGVELLVAHGQMDEDALEDRVMRFMAGEADVLLSTAIVESGLDNPRANTMVVWAADGFGLAQLHQLRGRVGRGRVAARMLLMSEADADDPEDAAAARLAAFAEMSEIGAGFRIARKDREMRGFGELDGEEQSGQLSRLGIGLYRHVLTSHLGGADRTGGAGDGAGDGAGEAPPPAV